MFTKFLNKIFTSSNDKIISKYTSIVLKINSFEKEMSLLSNDDFKIKTENFKKIISQSDDKQKALDLILPEAFALVREASSRVLGMRHFDVQLIGGIVLHNGAISEMKTGEGKTLVATLPAYLNSLTSNPVHIITVNDYLAKRDHDWMKPLYNFLGINVGFVNSEVDHFKRKDEYVKDITYVTNSEIGFDYLRDNMKLDKSDLQLINRGFHFAIIDEVDSILIDEARTPLIISGPSVHDPRMYIQINKIVKKLQEDDYEIDEKHKSIQLTDKGNDEAERMLKKSGLLQGDLYDIDSFHLINYILQSLKAHKIFKKDVDYIVKDKNVMIIDEFTGRIMDGRRYSDGLHQAIEAKEDVNILSENQTLASVTYQNFFRLYGKLSGMTGTALTEEAEFLDIYKLQVIQVPTNKPTARKDLNDLIFKNEKDKFTAIVQAVKESHSRGQPILIGTVSIEKSEILSGLLKKESIKHNLLNAKHHAREAEIIAEAGKLNAVTIATNMAGRGTDIKLGGSLGQEYEEVVKSGGLFVIGSQRHESRRIDNQLLGRSGRQGDPGRSQFFLSLHDDLLRIFGGEKIDSILSKIGFKDGEAIDHPMLNKVIQNSQKKVETFHYEMRKNLLKYDDISNDQRKIVYEQRQIFLETQNTENIILQIIKDVNHRIFAESTIDGKINIQELSLLLHNTYFVAKETIPELINNIEELNTFIIAIYENKIKQLNFTTENSNLSQENNIISHIHRRILLLTLDEVYREHLYNLDHVKEGIHLRSFAQKDPLSEYKLESFKLFEEMMDKFAQRVLQKVFAIEIRQQIT